MKKKVKRFIVSFLLIVSMVVSQCVNVGLAFADEPDGVQVLSEVEENQASETQPGKTDSVLNSQIEVETESESVTNISGETETQLETANDEQLKESELADKETESTDVVDSESMESDEESEQTEETQYKDYIIKVIKTNGSVVDVVDSANAGDSVLVYVQSDFYPTISVLSENEVFQKVTLNGYDSEKNAYVFQFAMPSYDVHISVYAEDQIALMSMGDTYTVGVSDYRYVEKDQAGYTISTGYFELTNGQQAFCCMHEKLAPTVGMVLTEAEKYTAENQLNETMRKVLYYGWHGPADTGVSYSITALAVSVANGHEDNYFKYGTTWINNTLANLPAPPASFTVTKLNNPNAAYQDLVFWSIENAYIQIEKSFEGGNNSYNPDVDSALYTIYTDAACTNEYHTPYISGNPSSFRIESNLKSGVITVEPGTYYIKETHAPSGWELDTRVYTVNASINTTALNPAKVTSTDKPSNGGFYLTKSSTYTEIVKNNNCYSLENAEYGVYSNANCAESSRIGTLKTDKNGKTQTLSVKKGTYYIKELTAPKGYMLDNTVYSVTVQASKTVEVKVQDKPYYDPAGIQLTKIAADTAEIVPLDGTQFTVCYYDGFYTANNLPSVPTRKWVIETQAIKNNKGETVYYTGLWDRYKIAGDAYYYDINNIPVLPLGTVTVEETKAADGYTLVGGYIQIEGTSEKLTGKYVAQIKNNQDGAFLVGGNQYTGVNYPVPDLSTKAKEAVNGTQSAKVSNNVKLVDTSMMEKLVVGETYELRTSLINKSTGQSINTVDGKSQISTTFTATSKAMNIDTEMTIDASDLSGCDVVFYEELYFRGTLVTEHKDIDAAGQTIHFSEIGTTALDKDTNDHVSNAAENMTIIDTVAYKNLEVGKTYTVTGILMDKETGKAALDDAGKEIKSNTTFTATSINGTVDVVFSFSGVKLKGKTLVAFESVSSDGVEYAVHANINDEGQSIHIPEIHTTALDKSSGSHNILAGEKSVIVDTVAYKNLIAGKEYTVTGTLINKGTGEAVLDAEGNAITSAVKFVPEVANDSVDVTFEFDSSALENETLVVFEEVFLNEKKVAVHADIDDADQTMYVPKIRTTALGKDTQNHNILAEESTVIVDTVNYKNLIPGKEYTVTGTLMDKATGKALQDAEGNAITSTVKFTPEESDGSIDIEFTFDASGLAGTTIVVFESVYINKKEVGVHADIEDEAQTVYVPEIHTTALDASSGSHNILASEKAVIVDTVAYKNLIAGKEYTVTGTLINKGTGEAVLDAEGNAITSAVKFVPEVANDSVDVTFEFDSSALENETLVVFEEVFLNEKKVAVHADIDDADQTMYVPKIRTTALGKDTQNHNILAEESTVIVDTVNYKNLIPGKEYTVTGTLMDKATGKALQDAEGNAITSTVKFTPEESDGSIDIEFTFDASGLAGTTIVVFESVYINKKEVGVHADIEDEAQTIYVPEIHTTALDESSGSHNVLAGKNAVIIDTVNYKNLIPGKEYTVTGTLMNKTTGEAVLDAEGNAITSTVKFVPEVANGSIDVTFEFDASALENETLVVYEEVFLNEKKVGIHADIEDTEQTIYVPEIHTNALDKSSGSHNILAGKEVTIVDTVSYKNLIVGQEYTVKGILIDKSTGDAVKDADGQNVSSKVTFRPENVNGSIDVEFTFDASGLAGTTIVVFESVLINEKEVAVHADIEDEAQTIHVPEIHTTALDNASGSQNMLAQKDAVIIDTVNYKNLIIGQKYTITGTLMDKSTGKAIQDANDKPVTSSVTFTAEKVNGSIDIEFKFDASALAGTTIVVFESVLVNEKEVGVHADIEDDAQTIYVPEIHTTATDKADGDKKIISSSTVTITDKVEYKNLIPGKTYTVKGVLMDKSTGKKLLINNLPVTSSVTFTAEKANGSINVDFTFNATGLKNRDVVVFETVLLDDFEIAVHEDIEDEGQTIHMLEKPGTLVPNYNNKNVKTGDDKPIFAILMVLLMSFIVTLSIVLYKRKLKKEL